MKYTIVTPEWQARDDWRSEGTFCPGQFHGAAAARYRHEARRIERESDEAALLPTGEGGRDHVRATHH
jgi:hypothetical protein